MHQPDDDVLSGSSYTFSISLYTLKFKVVDVDSDLRSQRPCIRNEWPWCQRHSGTILRLSESRISPLAKSVRFTHICSMIPRTSLPSFHSIGIVLLYCFCTLFEECREQGPCTLWARYGLFDLLTTVTILCRGAPLATCSCSNICLFQMIHIYMSLASVFLTCC